MICQKKAIGKFFPERLQHPSLSDLSCSFYNKRFAIRVCFPIEKEFVDFTF